MVVSRNLGAGGGHVVGVGKKTERNSSIIDFLKINKFATLVCSDKVSAITTQV